MVLTDCAYASALRCFEQKQPTSKAAASSTDAQDVFDEPAVLLNLSFDARSKDANKANSKDLKALHFEKKNEGKSSGVEDYSGRLTQRLVAAATREEVHAILSEAFKNLGKAIQAAAGGDKDAAEVVRRLNKLIRRANRKVRDLSKEEEIRRREKRAERKELELLEKELERELKRKIAERKKRERQYLKDAHPNDKDSKDRLKYLSGTITDARIKIIAQQMAQFATTAGIAHTGISAGMEATGGGDASDVADS